MAVVDNDYQLEYRRMEQVNTGKSGGWEGLFGTLWDKGHEKSKTKGRTTKKGIFLRR
jgi:hypothetical protein